MHAAREMLGRTKGERSIGEVALRCGFAHFGRFSVDYRCAFGETPTQTRDG
jgi:transcriptional regulator GlxA family with amidase domain